MNRVVFLVSGEGGTLKFIYYALKCIPQDIQIVGVLGDRDCLALEFGKKNKIYSKRINYNKFNNHELQEELKILGPDIIVTNIHKIIDKETLNLFPDKFINLHYSLLPAFAGLIGIQNINEKAKEQNLGFIGGSCHIVNKDVDAGKIICQTCFSVNWQKDLDSIDTLFKSSSIALLAGIFITLHLGESQTKNLSLNNKIVYFSPFLPFDKDFWERVIEGRHDSI
jgi:phosphoribosylglycinamide formyltransferase-1